MKKQVRMLSIVLIIMMALTTISSVVLAEPDMTATIKQISDGNGTQPQQVVTLGATIVTIMQTVGIVVAVVVLLILGIKYMMGSAEEKAEYKKTMIPYIVGAVLIFASTTIVNVVYNIARSFNTIQ